MNKATTARGPDMYERAACSNELGSQDGPLSSYPGPETCTKRAMRTEIMGRDS